MVGSLRTQMPSIGTPVAYDTQHTRPAPMLARYKYTESFFSFTEKFRTEGNMQFLNT